MPKVAQLKTKTESDLEMIPYAAESVPAGRLRVILDGVSPLLTHNPESMQISTDAKKGSRIPDEAVEAEAGVYRLPDGTCGLKGEAIRASLVGASGAWKVKRASLRSRVAHVVVVEELVPLMRRDGTPISDYVIDKRRAIVQRQGIIRRRPRFDEWSVALTIEYDPILVTEPKILVDVLNDAGNRMGIGDYRPAKNGWFGRFRVRAFKILD
jgi:hypothetical protein